MGCPVVARAAGQVVAEHRILRVAGDERLQLCLELVVIAVRAGLTVER